MTLPQKPLIKHRSVTMTSVLFRWKTVPSRASALLLLSLLIDKYMKARFHTQGLDSARIKIKDCKRALEKNKAMALTYFKILQLNGSNISLG